MIERAKGYGNIGMKDKTGVGDSGERERDRQTDRQTDRQILREKRDR